MPIDKKELRSQIKALKKALTSEQLIAQSVQILNKLELHPAFQQARIVMLYHSLPDEVNTHDFIEKWRYSKRIILPTVVGDDIVPVELTPQTEFVTGDFNIQEPQDNPYTGTYDLIVVPGIAFDKRGNRIGRGRGYYDRFLCQHSDVPTIGICFDFQLVDHVPTEPTDIQMDEVVTIGK